MVLLSKNVHDLLGNCAKYGTVLERKESPRTALFWASGIAKVGEYKVQIDLLLC